MYTHPLEPAYLNLLLLCVLNNEAYLGSLTWIAVPDWPGLEEANLLILPLVFCVSKRLINLLLLS